MASEILNDICEPRTMWLKSQEVIIVLKNVVEHYIKLKIYLF